MTCVIKGERSTFLHGHSKTFRQFLLFSSVCQLSIKCAVRLRVLKFANPFLISVARLLVMILNKIGDDIK